MWTRRVYPPKALVLLLLNPSLSLQGCAVFIGAKQGPRTGSGAALSTSGSYRSLSGKQLCKLPGSFARTSQQIPSGDSEPEPGFWPLTSENKLA